MRLLILGGSWFLGRTIAMDAFARGWDVTAFSRGKSGLPPAGVSHVVGDRRSDTDLRRLAASGPWDAVIDTSAYEPTDVARTTEALNGRVEQYVLVSTVSVYQDWPTTAVNESSPLWHTRSTFTEQSPELADMSIGKRYGTLKAGCEIAVTSSSKRSLIVRPGVILGPGEYIGRALKLIERAARGGQWLLPSPPEQPIQPLDVRDVSSFLLDAIQTRRDGAFNLVAPVGHATFGDLIDICLDLTGRRAQPVWVDAEWLAKQDVRQWTEIPLWRTAEGTWRVDGQLAAAAGLQPRPLSDMLEDFKVALDRDGLIDHPRQRQLGMAPEKEAELLAKWFAADASGARKRQA
ncbi:NAD-dependent epimerase/dehydratase family protein [Kribbella italica]|uniref:Nucleoside-diphosphate-sugar epimerase n=1 Tax=Kribbella italica TaxID=1540520 RepID=A0A7W9JFT9_9ACTN|nr:NAD-dependent epimerase/dehydratase family protein [Kribbella italica]MBB5841134.1 nucleoside-diphosphate-sugar epimerase [Kribbella italica]